MAEMLAAAQGCLGPWIVVLFAAGALYATFNVGFSGGPNKGDHPLTLTIVHVVLFFIFARGWSRGAWWAYLGVLTLTLVYAGWSMTLVGEQRAGRLWTARGIMFALHAALFAIAAVTG